MSIRADDNNILGYTVDIKGETVKVILLPKALRPWIIASCHEFSGHQGESSCLVVSNHNPEYTPGPKWALVIHE